MISNELKQRLKDLGQFPYGKRDRAYQSIDGEPGIRDMNHRYEVIQFPKSFDGETVIDFGCSAGAICLDAKKRGAKRQFRLLRVWLKKWIWMWSFILLI